VLFYTQVTTTRRDRITQQHKHTTNITTMVVEPLAPPARGFDESTNPRRLRVWWPWHVRSKATIKEI
jgi:hypothetical protein